MLTLAAAVRREQPVQLRAIDVVAYLCAAVQYLAPELLRARGPIQAQIQQSTVKNLTTLRRATSESACRVLQVEGGWYATLQVPRVRSEEAWTIELLSRGVLVQPGFFFDFESEAFLVLSLLTEPPIFEEGVQHILDAC